MGGEESREGRGGNLCEGVSGGDNDKHNKNYKAHLMGQRPTKSALHRSKK